MWLKEGPVLAETRGAAHSPYSKATLLKKTRPSQERALPSQTSSSQHNWCMFLVQTRGCSLQRAKWPGMMGMTCKSGFVLVTEEERVQLAKQLAGATGCVVEVGAGRAFIAGRKGSRALCSEYISWVNDGLQFHVDLKRRADTAIRPEVPLALTEMPWLQQQLSELAIDTSTIAFFDNEEGREGQLKRLIFAGNDQGWLLEDDERENGGSTEGTGREDWKSGSREDLAQEWPSKEAAVDATEATDKAQSLIVLETRDWDFCMW
eukprot:g5011.t1